MKDYVFILAVTFNSLVVFGQQKMQNLYNVSIATEENVGKQSEEYYLKEIKSKPNNPVVYYNMGLYYSIKYQFDSAEAQYLKAIALDSGFTLAHTGLAGLFLASGQMEKAIVACEQALQMDTFSAQNYLNMGVMQFQNMKFEEAESSFLKGITLDSMNALIYLNLGTLIMQTNRQTEAVVYLKKALQLNPKDPGSPYSLASIYSAQENIEEGFTYLEIALMNGISFYDMLQINVSLTTLRKNSIRWKAIMKKHFPDKIKN